MRFRFLIVLSFAAFFIAGCGLETNEVFTINPDLTGKCAINARMYADTSALGARLASKDSLYGITPAVPDFHKKRFSRKDAMTLALDIIKTKGVEVWNNVRFGISKKKDMIYFSGIAYFRDITKVHFSMLDSSLKVTREPGNKLIFTLDPSTDHVVAKQIPEDTINKKVGNLMQNAFYIRPVLADLVDHTEATIIYKLPGSIINSSIFDRQGDSIVTISITGNDIMKYADSLAKNRDLAEKEYKATNGTHTAMLEPLFNRIAYGTGVPIEVEINKSHQNQFDYFEEERNAMVYFDDYMQQSKLEKFDSTSAIKEERAESKRPEEYGILVVNKVDSTAKKPYFNDMSAIISHDTITFSGELSQDIKADESKIHILRLISGTDQDITDSIATKNKIIVSLSSEQGDKSPKAAKRKVSFMVVVHFPPGCKEISVQGRLSTTVSGKPGAQVPFKMKQIAVSAKGK